MAVLSSSYLGFDLERHIPRVEITHVEAGDFEFFGPDDLYLERLTFWLKVIDMPGCEFWAKFLLDDDTARLVYGSESFDPSLNPEFFSDVINTCVNHPLDL